MHAATVEAAAWWQRPRETAWITNYQRSLQARHRTQIVETIRGLGDVKTVLEVGCHCGPNLVRLAREFPAIELLSGVDVNADAIHAGQRWASELGLGSRIELAVGRIPDATDHLPSGCADVVLSCYALAYIAPADVDAVLFEMGRLAKRAIVLAEPMAETGSGTRALTGYHEWAHNYRDASRWINTWRGTTITTQTIDPPVDRLNGILVAAFGDT